MRHPLLSLSGLVLFLMAGSSLLTAQRFSTRGTDFWFSFPQTATSANTPELTVFLSGDAGITGTVAVPGIGFTQNFTLNGAGTAEVMLPQNAMHVQQGKRSRGVHITADDTLRAFASNFQQFATDASLILPTQTLEADYRILTYNENTSGGNPTGCEFVITAVEDSTEIEITPAAFTTAGNPAGTPFTIMLNQGESYLVQSGGDLSGTRVRGTQNGCNPFAIMAGHVCTNISKLGNQTGQCPPNNCCCDHILEAQFPLNTWGKKFIALPYIGRNGDLVRVLAHEDNTTVTFTSGDTWQMNAGETRDTVIFSNDRMFIEADKRVAVAELSRSNQCDGSFFEGDPFLTIIPPLEQATVTRSIVNSLDLPMPPSGNSWNHTINVLMETDDTASFTLNGQSINNPPFSAQFNPVPGATTYAFAEINIANPGNNILEADSGFSAYIYGFNEDDSYGYMAGFALNNTNVSISQDNDSACTGEPVSFAGDASFNVAQWRWDFGDGTTALGQNVTHSYAAPGTYEVKLEALGNGSCGLAGGDSTFAEVVVIGPVPDSLSAVPVSCPGAMDGELTVGASGGVPPYEFSIDSLNFLGPQPQASFTGLAEGEQVYFVRDDSGCVASDTVQLGALDEPGINFSQVENTACAGASSGEASLSGTNGTSPFEFSADGTNFSSQSTFTGLAAGDQIFFVRDADGCIGSDTVTIGTDPPPEPVFNNLQNVSCNGAADAQVTLTGSLGDAPFEFSADGTNFSSQSTFTGLAAGDQIFFLRDANGCVGSDTIAITEPAPLTLAVDVTPISCHGAADGEVMLQVSGGTQPYQHGLNAGPLQASPLFTGLAPDTGSVRVADANGCTASNSFALAQPTPVNAGPDTQVCANAPVFVPNADSATPAGGVWSGPAGIVPGTGRIVPENLDAANTLLIYSVNGCPDSLQLDFLPAPEPAFRFDPEEALLPDNGTIQFTNETAAADSFVWQFGDGDTSSAANPAHTYDEVGEFNVVLTAVNDSGCVDSTSATLVATAATRLLIPTAFSPNADNLNEVWEVEAQNIDRWELRIFSRWGGEILTSEGDAQTPIVWDGTYEDGTPVQEGVYVFTLTGQRTNGTPFERKGTITLIR